MARGIRLGTLSTTILLVIVLATIGACTGTPPLPRRAQGEPAPQVVVAIESDEEPLASCGPETAFPAAAVEEPIGPDDRLAPGFEGLNEILDEFRTEFRLPDDTTWRLAFQDAEGAIFLTQQAGDLIFARVRAESSGWRAREMGVCGLHGVVSRDLGAAAWWLDDRLPPPSSESIDLPVLLMELACANGSFATGRIASPIVRYSAESVVVTAAVQTIGGTCPTNPATPAVFILPEPIGDRQVLDGYHVPPAPPYGIVTGGTRRLAVDVRRRGSHRAANEQSVETTSRASSTGADLRVVVRGVQ